MERLGVLHVRLAFIAAPLCLFKNLYSTSLNFCQNAYVFWERLHALLAHVREAALKPATIFSAKPPRSKGDTRRSRRYRFAPEEAVAAA
jgi:hypothetical protein